MSAQIDLTRQRILLVDSLSYVPPHVIARADKVIVGGQVVKDRCGGFFDNEVPRPATSHELEEAVAQKVHRQTFSERFFDRQEREALQPVPSPSQVRAMAKTDALHRELRAIAKRHPMPPVVLPGGGKLLHLGCDFTVVPLRIADFREQPGFHRQVAMQIVKDRTTEFNGHPASAARVRYPDEDASLGNEWTRCSIAPRAGDVYEVTGAEGTSGFIRWSSVLHKWTNPGPTRDLVKQLQPIHGPGSSFMQRYRWRKVQTMTDWNLGTVAPRTPGVYELRPAPSSGKQWFARFAKEGHWMQACGTVYEAQETLWISTLPNPADRISSAYQWRGFTTQQE